MEKELIEFFNKMKSNVTDKTGYIWLPSNEGYKLFEIPAERLDFYLRMESLHNKAINSDELSEPEADGCNKQAKELKSDSNKVKIEIKSMYIPDMRYYPIIKLDFNG